MNENKEIEEMARTMGECYTNTPDCKTCDEKSGYSSCYIKNYAKILYNAGYRNVKDKVVLTKEERKIINHSIEYLERVCNSLEKERSMLEEELCQASELKAETIKLAKQETARDIFNALGFITYRKKGKAYIFDVKELRELAKEYKVEVE